MKQPVLPAVLCAGLAFLAAPGAGHAAPLRDDHPFIGTWTFRMPDSGCAETMTFLSSGRMLISSGQEVGESEFELADQPGENGFYRWVDTIRKDNGKKDCGGRTTPVGDVATAYLRLHPTGRMFLLCFEERLDRCVGPYVRQGGEDA